VEQHGFNPEQKVTAVIPARFSSTRLERKLLLDIGGLPMVVRTMLRALEARNVARVIVATDDERVARVVREHHGEAAITSREHQSGSDRVAEVAERFTDPGSIVVNVQGDEPLISPLTIERAVNALIGESDADIATTSEPVGSASEVLDPNVVKVVTDGRGRALYFSRSPIPYPRDAVIRHGSIGSALRNEPELLGAFRKHTGLYAYRREYLLRFAKLGRSAAERIEMLEQLRALDDGARIRVVEVADRSVGIDTAEDLEIVRRMIGQ
jgi:3-deoxy-manno-octulosonate cytidylyltransferase (CMP-KDO synthetase)